MNDVANQVYCLTFPNGKQYIGVSVDPVIRMFGHRRNQGLLGHAIRKHGEPEMRILLVGSREYCMLMEGRLTDGYNTVVPNGYNLQRGGTGGSIPSEMSKQRMSEAHMGYRASGETKAKMRAVAKNRLPISEETRQRISVSAKKRGMPRAVIEAGAISNRGKRQSEERRAATSKRMKIWWANRRQEGV